MSTLGTLLLSVLVISGCATTPSPVVAFDFLVDCGPISETARCHRAIEVALTAKINPPPTWKASIRRPRADDDCATNAFHPCGPEAIIVEIYSGDTTQGVALVRTADGWVRFDQIR